MLIKLTMLLIFFAVMVAIGLYCRKTASDVNGFVLGGRSVGPWLTAFAYGTSYFSAVVFVGYAGQFGWKYGIAATWAGIGNALLGSLLAWVVLGHRTRIMSQHLDSATMPEFFGKRFGSPSLKVAASVIIFIFLIPYTASLYNGLSRLFGMAFNIDYSVCVIVMAVLTGVYVIAGGYMATAINDFIQGIIMLFGICAVILAVLNSQGGFLAALEGLAQVSDPAVSSAPGVFASFFGPDPVNLLGVVLTMYDARNRLTREVRDEVQRCFPDHLFGTVIPRNVRLSEAPSHGKSIIHYDIKSKGADAYLNLAKEVALRDPARMPQPR